MAGQQFFDVLAMGSIGAKGPTNVVRIAADAAGNLKTSVKGGAFTPIGGGFGADTIVPLPNSALANVSAWESIISLTSNTPSSEASQWVGKYLKAGAQVTVFTWTPDTLKLESTTAMLSLFSDVTIFRDISFGNINFTSNQGDMVQASGAATLTANSTLGFMQTTQSAGPPTGTPARLAATHRAMTYDIANGKDFSYSAQVPIWIAAGDNMQLQAVLTNADISRDISTGSEAVLPNATLTGAHILTLAVTGSPITGDVIRVTRLDSTANTYTIKDDAATTLLAMPVSKRMGADFKFNGTHFVLDRRWSLN